MKRFLSINLLLLLFLGTVSHQAFGFLDVIGKVIGALKKDIVESVITTKIAALQPRLLTFEEKGKLVRFGGLFALLMSIISLSANGIVITHAVFQAKKRKDKIPVATLIKIPILLTLISLSLLGVSFSAFWFGEYLINLPESVREFIIKK